MDIIKKINVNGEVNFYKLHRVGKMDVLHYYNECFSEGEILWKFHNVAWWDASEPDFELENNRKVKGSIHYLKFDPQDLVQD